MTTGDLDLLVLGNLNLETRVCIESFPVTYAKMRFVPHGISDRVAGVGFNVAVAASAAGARVGLAALTGSDWLGTELAAHVRRAGLEAAGLVAALTHAPRSVILAGPAGEEAILTDLKHQESTEYPTQVFTELLQRTRHVHVTNIGWALTPGRLAREKGRSISTDLHNIRCLNDEYNRPFLELADIVFFSAENLAEPPESVIRRLWETSSAVLAICGRGAEGVILGDRRTKTLLSQPAARMREPVRGTTGTGDRLAGIFLAHHLRGANPEAALREALAAVARD